MAASGPVVIGFDGSAAALHAVRSAGGLLAGRRGLVVVVWKQGLGFELLSLPTSSVGLPPTTLNVAEALEADRTLYERAEELAQQGAALAREAGLEADALIEADDVDVPISDTLTRVAREHDAAALVVGSHHHGREGELLPGTITRGVLRRATVPVLVVRHTGAD
jgi:nucleotide-binding universal stress UspA family protein